MTREELFCHIKALHDFCKQYPSDRPCRECPFYIEDWQTYSDEWEDGSSWCLFNFTPDDWPMGEIEKRLKGDEHGISEEAPQA